MRNSGGCSERRAAFQDAPPQSLAAFHPHRTSARRHSIPGPGATFEHQGVERPVRIGAHLDSAVAADQDRHFLATIPALERSQGGVQQTLSLRGEAVHSFLIAIPG